MTNKATPEVVAALANPVRLKLLYEITAAGRARTSDLAQAVELAPNKVSYHLKKLGAAGVVTKQPGDDARETWWSAVPGGWQVDDPELAPGLTAALALLDQHVRDRSEAFAAQQRDAGVVLPFANGDTVLTLGLGDARALADELSALIERYVGLPTTTADDAEPGGAEPGGAGSAEAGPGGAGPAEPGPAEAGPGGTEPGGAEPGAIRYDFRFSLLPIGHAAPAKEEG